MAFTITTKGKNLFGACNVDYAVGSAVGASMYNGVPTVLADRIIFHLGGGGYAGNNAEIYKKTLTLEPNIPYTLSFTLTESARVFMNISDNAGLYAGGDNITSPITISFL